MTFPKANSQQFIEIVPSANVGRETLYVLLISIVIALCSTLAVLSHTDSSSEDSPSLAHQIDLRENLTANEQGIYTDLKTVYDEWAAQYSEPFVIISPQQWADDGWPPFSQDITNQQRGNYQWRLINRAGYYGYFGHSLDNPEAARIFWRLPHPYEIAEDFFFDVWISYQQNDAPQRLYDEELINAGWKQVTSTFVAGVTR